MDEISLFDEYVETSGLCRSLAREFGVAVKEVGVKTKAVKHITFGGVVIEKFGEYDILCDSSRDPEVKARIDAMNKVGGGFRARIYTENFMIKAVIPDDRKHMIRLLKGEGYKVETGEIYG